ncbi:MAG TPA: hypothetical protein VK544_07530 [Gemmatimonadaceae bacterium]|nr:hypothetical protein [Gemmatimonadaceae bacterium]
MKNTAFIKLQIRTTLVSMSFLTAASCTAYTPIHGVETATGSNVRVRLTDKGAVDLAPRIGPRARQLEGTLRQATDSLMVISVRRVVREGEGADTYDGLEVSVPRQDIETAEASRTSVSRSFLTAGAILASALLVARGASDISGGGGNRPPPAGQ